MSVGTQQLWQVVGGSDAGGILVRYDFDRKSQLHPQRLGTASVVQEITRQDGRLNYRLVHGSGPGEGWVSIRIGSKELLEPVKVAPAQANYRSRRPLSELTYDERHAIHLDLLAGYSKFTFQQELHSAWDASNGDEGKQVKMRWAVCWNVQGPIFKQHGFAGSPHDLLQSNACFSVQDANKVTMEPAELKAAAWLMWLIHPPAQVVHPDGPPSDLMAAEILEVSVPGFSSQIPKSKVLARIPCRHFVHDQVCSIRVVGAITGEVLCSADVAPSDRVCDLKRFIYNLQGTPVAEQKLLLDGRLLQCDFEEVAWLFHHAPDAVMSESHCLTLSLVRLTAARAALLKALESGTQDLENLEPDLRGDMECILAAVKRKPSALKYASWSLLSDRNFVLTASKTNGGILQYAEEWAREDREIVLAAVQLDGGMLKFVSAKLRGDYEVVRSAVDKDGMALQFATAFLRADADLVHAAVEHAGASLQYADLALRGEERIVLAALGCNREGALPHVAPELLQNYIFRKSLEAFGLLEDGYFDFLFWATPEVAKDHFDRGEAIFIDARPLDEYLTSRVPGAFSLPSAFVSPAAVASDMQIEAVRAVLDSADSDCPVIVYSSVPGRPCLLVQLLLRARPQVKKFRILRLVGGFSLWMSRGYSVVSASNQEMHESNRQVRLRNLMT